MFVDRMRVEEKIKEIHNGDEAQLEVIFSDDKKLLVEAPAGYGKTKTMISKIAYLLASGKLTYPKKILALTFSVNAAYKIKKEVSEQLPSMIDIDNFYPVKVNEKVYISNYHGFSRHLLNLYGYLLHESLREIQFFNSIDDSDIQKLQSLGIGITLVEAEFLSNYNQAVRKLNYHFIKSNWNEYVEIIINKFLVNNLIPYNGILILAITLLQTYDGIKDFYQGYFPIVIVDEFQDTNILSWQLLITLIYENTRVLFMGDSLQRIYGFIGAIPNLMTIAQEKLVMKKIELSKNYRFADNNDMLLLDKNIRLNAENVGNPVIERNAKIPFIIKETQQDEVYWVCNKIKELMANDSYSKIAILVKQRSKNVDALISELTKHNINYFFGLFNDEDIEYFEFHMICTELFTKHLKNIGNRISKSNLNKLFLEVDKYYAERKTKIIDSLLRLLRVFFSNIIDNYSFLSNEDKIIYIKDTFDNRALKQQMENLDEKVILSTIHSAKGLEWTYVIMPDMEQYVFPSYTSLCGSCARQKIEQGKRCILTNPQKIENEFLDELSVFYVGLTRARKQVFFSASEERIDYYGNIKKTNISCILNRPGIEFIA